MASACIPAIRRRTSPRRLVPETQTYRNLALHRPAYHSSSYDYNLTAQLVTDGIKETSMPRWVSVSASEGGTLKKQEREHLVDNNPVSTVDFHGTRGWVQVELGGGDTPFEVDRVDLFARVQTNGARAAGWTCVVTGSNDGQTWTEMGRASGTERPMREIKLSVTLASAAHSRFYRVEFEAASVFLWNVGEVTLFEKNQRVEVGGPFHFTSAWKSAGSDAEWVYVDLGAVCTFERVALYWIRRAAEGAVQASADAKEWKTLQLLPTASGLSDDLKLTKPATGRYVRVLMTRAASAADGYVLSELEVYGHGGPVARPKPAPETQADGMLVLAGGAWRVQRDSLVSADGAAISRAGFQDKDWLVATVPGTVLSSYWNAGTVPDPNYGKNQLMISDSFFYADFWYRDEFTAPGVAPGQHLWLNFSGINWKADVFLNGEKLGSIEGGFMRGRFDVTRLAHAGARNALAVLVKKNATPGSVKEKTLETPDKNGGSLGADNPTYHASVGWDWIPTIRGRNTGIWGGSLPTAKRAGR